MRIIATDFGTAELEAARLAAVARAARDTQPVMYRIVRDMFRIEGILFQSQGRRGGGSWKRLKEDTIRKKGTTRILFTRGADPSYKSLPGDDVLFQSVARPGAAYQDVKVFRNRIEFGTRRPHAASHQYGAPRKNIPARPFIEFLATDEIRWRRWIGEHIVLPHRAK